MKLICVDIGIHNFSFIVAQINSSQNSFDIQYIENKDLLPNTNINKLILDQSFFNLFHIYLKSIHSVFENCDACVIEKQLFSKKNFKACTVYHHLIAHLSIFFPKMKIIGFPSKNKYIFQSYQKMSYTQRKKWAVNYVSSILQHQKDETVYEWLHTCFKKKDDICDCVLIFLSHAFRKGLLTRDCLPPPINVC